MRVDDGLGGSLQDTERVAYLSKYTRSSDPSMSKQHTASLMQETVTSQPSNGTTQVDDSPS